MEFEELKEIIADIFGWEVNKITLATRLNEDLKLNSMNVIELMTAMEEHFGITIDEGRFIDTQTVEELLEYLKKA